MLVTGAAGFIASHVADYCANKLGFETVAVDDLSGGFLRNVPEAATFVNVSASHVPFAWLVCFVPC